MGGGGAAHENPVLDPFWGLMRGFVSTYIYPLGLQINGLEAKKLCYKDLVNSLAFHHCNGTVQIPVPKYKSEIQAIEVVSSYILHGVSAHLSLYYTHMHSFVFLASLYMFI